MKGFPGTVCGALGLALLSAAGARAHFALLQPLSALATEDGGKGPPPCGGGTDSNVVTAAQGGHAIAIRLSEFVFHPGHYRFALSVNSRAELPPDPDVVEENGLSVSASIQKPAKIPVLADGVFAHTSPPDADWQMSLTLPNLTCEKCTLQIIEFMAEHGANVGGGFFYHHCADLRITADPNLPPADSAWPRAAQLSRAAFSHLAAGGGWTTTMTLANPSTSPVPVTVTFHGDDGGEFALPSTVTQGGVTQNARAPSVNATIPPNATLQISVGEQMESTFGAWADVQSSGALGGYAIFRSAPKGGPPSEGTAPLQSQAGSSVTIAYDNTQGFVTGIALANLSAGAAEISATMWDDGGNLVGTQTIRIDGSGHVAFAMPNQLPATSGRRGIVQFRSAGGMVGLGLRFSPLGTFTSLPVM